MVASLAQRRWRALVGYAYLLTGSVAEAEDLVQDALVKVVLRGRAGTDLYEAEAYARQAVLTVFLDGQRRRTRWARIAPVLDHEHRSRSGTDPGPGVAAKVDLHAALARLSARERACVVLRHLEDLSVAETAERLGVSQGAVKKYTSTAMARLEGTLGPVSAPSETSAIEGSVTR